MSSWWPESLELQAADGTPIPNSRDPDPDPNFVAFAQQASTIESAQRLAPATGRYNCHGLVFASRRTNIDGPVRDVDIDDLLKRDGYVPIYGAPQVGDVVVYRRPGEDVVDHTGYVVRIELIGTIPVVFVWSAWGGLGEFEHREGDSPYKECNREYWRLQC